MSYVGQWAMPENRRNMLAGDPFINLPASFSDFDIGDIDLAYKSIQRQKTILAIAPDFCRGGKSAHTESSNFDWVVFRKPIMDY